MSYSNLIEEIFLESRKCIPENEFLKKLPALLEAPRKRWNGENLAIIVKKRMGLGGEDKHTFKKIADEFNIAESSIAGQYHIALSLLRRLARIPEYVTELRDYEIEGLKRIEEEDDKFGWVDSLSRAAKKALYRMDIKEKDECAELFQHPPRMKYRSVIHPTIPERHSGHTYKSERMPLKVFNEIRMQLGIDPFELPAKKPTAAEIARAVNLLESEGYTVTKQSA